MLVLEYPGAAAATAVIMSHTLRKQRIVFVEGKGDVLLLFTLYEESCMPIAARGVEGVLKALDLIHEKNSTERWDIRAIGFVDRDYSHLRDQHGITMRNDVVLTSYRDIEVDLFCAKSFERLLNEKAAQGKFTAAEDVIQGIMSRLCKFSKLRAYNALHDKGWSFSCLDVVKYVDTKGNIDLSKLFSCFKQRNRITSLEWSMFEAWESDTEICLKSISRGHDISTVVGQMLRGSLGSRSNAEASCDIVEENLRLATIKTYVELYDWHREIKSWSSSIN